MLRGDVGIGEIILKHDLRLRSGIHHQFTAVALWGDVMLVM
jgi:hypothetical protein